MLHYNFLMRTPIAIVSAVVIFVGCHGWSPTAEPSRSDRTIVHLSIDRASCVLPLLFRPRGNFAAISSSFAYQGDEIVMAQDSVNVELPRGGTYRAYFWTGPNELNQLRVWSKRITIAENATANLTFDCR